MRLASLSLGFAVILAGLPTAIYGLSCAESRPEGRVLVIGDSITRAIPPSMAPGIENRGKDGDIVSGVEGRLRFDPPEPDDTLVIAVGLNDLLKREAAEPLADYDHLLRTLPPVHRLIVSAVLPANESPYAPVDQLNARILAFNAALRVLAERRGATYINARDALIDENGRLRATYTRDGLHLTPAGNVAWVGDLWRTVECGSQSLRATGSDRTGP